MAEQHTLSPELAELDGALDDDDPERLDDAVDGLATKLGMADADLATTTATEGLRLLRRRRRFPEMLRVAEGAFRAGSESPTVARLYAQALIEQKLLGAALAVLGPLRQHPGSEATEIDGLIGRANKQRYVESPTSAGAERHLGAAIDAYLARFTAAPEQNLWQGINAVAMLARAERDGRATGEDADWRAIADRLLDTIRSRPAGAREVWDSAIAAEAYVALGDFPAAAGWLASYTAHAEAEAFEFAGTLRQLRQVWQIDEQDPPQRALVALLEARLLRANGGKLDVDAAARAHQLDDDAEYLEAVFGEDEYKTIQWYRAGLEAAKSVARIVGPLAKTVGTGFVLPGEALHPAWAGRLVVLTNFHVANRLAVHPGRAPADLRVQFEDDEEAFPIEKILWESPFVAPGTNPPGSFDTTVLLLHSEVPPPAPSYQLSTGPTPGVDERVYVIGYPLGQALAFSLHDNKVLGSSAALIHYRAPTRPGSSGSPVFDEEWRLIGLHHAGAPNLARLDQPDTTYAANEGLLLGAIGRHLGTVEGLAGEAGP